MSKAASKQENYNLSSLKEQRQRPDSLETVAAELSRPRSTISCPGKMVMVMMMKIKAKGNSDTPQGR